MTSLGRAINIVVGIVLWVAGGMKFAELIFEPHLNGTIPSSWVWKLGLIDAEIILGSLLITFIQPLWTRRVSISVFLIFVVFSSYAAIVGKESCNCFGRLVVPPALMVVIDIIIIVLLYLTNPPASALVTMGKRRLMLFFLLMGSVTSASFGFFPIVYPKLGDSTRNVAILDPNTLIHQQWPFRIMSNGNRLASGTWLLLLIHADCGVCRNVLSDIITIRKSERGGESINFAVLVMPPYDQQMPINSQSLQLISEITDKSTDWFAATPVAVELIDGQVVDVSDTPDMILEKIKLQSKEK